MRKSKMARKDRQNHRPGSVSAFEAAEHPFKVDPFDEANYDRYVESAEGTSLSPSIVLSERIRRIRVLAAYELQVRAKARTPTPAGAEKILLLLVPAERVEELQGDFEEGFRLVCELHGPTFAKWWYRAQVCRAALSRGFAVVERILAAISPFK